METSSPSELNEYSPIATNPAETSSAESKAKADSSTTAYADPSAVIVVSRVMFNYVVIAIVFFLLGTLISGAAVSALFNANSVENQALIANAAQAVAASGGGQQVAGLVQGNTYKVSMDNDPFRGAADAPVTIIEFSDFHCAFCGRFAAETLDPLLKNYDGKVRLVYRDYPFQTTGSVVAALAGECMNEQGKFWEFHDLTFKNQQALTREQFITYAQQLGVDVASFTTCLDSQKYMDKVKKDVADAQALGVNGTPAFFVNGRFISGAQPYTVFASYIDEELGKQAESPVAPVSPS
ncbi:MAG: thioredoxin domain-containing protein [Anaerolineaceae bacterium]|nr:thioredoxin domain-containing protein [Anaerolineaceae bacterium]